MTAGYEDRAGDDFIVSHGREQGWAGDDLMVVAPEGESANGGFGDDTLISFSQDKSWLYGSEGDDVLFGFGQQTSLIGGDGADTFYATENSLILDYDESEGDQVVLVGGNVTQDDVIA